MIGRPLFSKYSLEQTIDASKKYAISLIQSVDIDDKRAPNTIATEIYNECKIEYITLNEDQTKTEDGGFVVEPNEQWAALGVIRPCRKKVYNFTIPFTGDIELFDAYTSKIRTTFPFADINGGRVVIHAYYDGDLQKHRMNINQH